MKQNSGFYAEALERVVSVDMLHKLVTSRTVR
jgi:hypothetical protein